MLSFIPVLEHIVCSIISYYDMYPKYTAFERPSVSPTSPPPLIGENFTLWLEYTDNGTRYFDLRVLTTL